MWNVGCEKKRIEKERRGRDGKRGEVEEGSLMWDEG